MADQTEIHQGSGIVRLEADGSVTISPGGTAQGLSFYNPAGPWVGQQTITGSKGANVALANLITALANLGLITDQTT